MMTLARGSALLAALLSTALHMPTQARAPAEPAPAATSASALPSQPWAHLSSDVPVDADVRFGTLPNGMRYAIQHNATPPGQAALRLRIDAGSLMENDDQRGLAHFTEHMAFNGTTHIPENELIHILERLGLAFGADTNAATGFDQTFYTLSLPRTNDETVDTALHIMREQVSEAVMDPKAIDEERGVVAGEERTRNSPALRVSNKQLPIIAKGQKVAHRMPIGDLEIIRTAPRARFVEFYQSYYRPSRATLIAVGDFDVAAMEAKILKTFGDWRPKAAEGPEPELGAVAAHGEETYITVEPGVGSSISLMWTQQPDLRPDTVANRRDDVIAYLGRAVLNRRLSELTRIDKPPFLSAVAGRDTLVRSIGLASLSATYVEGKWKEALEAIDQEQRRAVTFGVTQAELDRELNSYRTALVSAVAGAPTRDTGYLANNLLSSVNDRDVPTSPKTNLALFEAAVKGLTVEDVNAALKAGFAGDGPMTLIVSPVAIDGGEKAVAGAFQASRQVAVAAPRPPVKMAWPYTDFGKKGVVTGKRALKDLGATVVTFANGTVLTVKSTKFDKDRISIGVLTGGGERNFAPDRFDPLATMLGGMTQGGLGKMNVDEVSRSLNGHVYGIGFGILPDKFLLSGATRGEDLQLEMQYITAHLTDPAFRTIAFDQSKASYPATYAMSLATPGGAFAVHTQELRAGGDKRQGIVPPELLSNWSMDGAAPALKALLADGPLHVTIVGDVTLERAIAVTASTFGALPPRPATKAAVPGADQRRFPGATGETLRFTHKGLAEQSMGYVAWPTTDVAQGFTEARRIEVMAAVLKLRVQDEIRERQALAYSPGVATSFSDTYKDYGSLAIQAQTAPDKLPDFFAAVDKIVKDMRDRPVTEDELKRARAPLVEAAKRGPTLNSWWFSSLLYVTDRPHYIAQVTTTLADVEAVTTADVQALAQKYLRPDTAWKAMIVPETN